MLTVKIIKSTFPLLDNIACREMEHSKRGKCTYSILNSLSLTCFEKVVLCWIAEPEKNSSSPSTTRRPLKFLELLENLWLQLKRSLHILLFKDWADKPTANYSGSEDIYKHCEDFPYEHSRASRSNAGYWAHWALADTSSGNGFCFNSSFYPAKQICPWHWDNYQDLVNFIVIILWSVKYCCFL